MRYLLLFSAFLIPVLLMAQVPGYIGKRNGISLTLSSFVGYNNADEYVPGSDMTINIRPTLSVERILSHNVMMGVDYNFLPTKLSNYANYATTVDSVTGESLVTGFYGDVRIYAHMFGYYLQFFNTKRFGAIAPVGRCNRFEFMVYTATFKSLESKKISNNPVFNDWDLTVDNISKISNLERNYKIILLYSFGRQMPVNEKYLINFGTQIGYQFDKYRRERGNAYFINYDMFERVGGAMFLNIQFGLQRMW